MKKILLVAVFVFLFQLVNAQTERGDWMIGGGLELNTSNNKTTFAFNPNIGWFVANNFAIGAQMFYSFDKLGDNRVNSFGAGPYTRYYFVTKSVRPYLHADMNFETNKIENSTGNTTVNAFSFYVGAGAAFFINQNVAVEPLIGYRHTDLKDTEGGGSGLGFTLGFQIYINRNQAESVRSSLSKR